MIWLGIGIVIGIVVGAVFVIIIIRKAIDASVGRGLGW